MERIVEYRNKQVASKGLVCIRSSSLTGTDRCDSTTVRLAHHLLSNAFVSGIFKPADAATTEKAERQSGTVVNSFNFGNLENASMCQNEGITVPEKYHQQSPALQLPHNLLIGLGFARRTDKRILGKINLDRLHQITGKDTDFLCLSDVTEANQVRFALVFPFVICQQNETLVPQSGRAIIITLELLDKAAELSRSSCSYPSERHVRTSSRTLKISIPCIIAHSGPATSSARVKTEPVFVCRHTRIL